MRRKKGYRYSPTNVKKIDKRYVYKDIFDNERKINNLLNDFTKNFYNMKYPNSYKNYVKMYNKKTYLKRVLIEQQKNAFRMNQKRYNIMNSQLTRFKKIYVAWKNKTRYAFLTYMLKVPPFLINNFYGDLENDKKLYIKQ